MKRSEIWLAFQHLIVRVSLGCLLASSLLSFPVQSSTPCSRVLMFQRFVAERMGPQFDELELAQLREAAIRSSRAAVRAAVFSDASFESVVDEFNRAQWVIKRAYPAWEFIVRRCAEYALFQAGSRVLIVFVRGPDGRPEIYGGMLFSRWVNDWSFHFDLSQLLNSSDRHNSVVAYTRQYYLEREARLQR